MLICTQIFCFSAVDAGTEMLELDVHITKDNQVVVSHDQNLFRTTGVQVNIGDLRYDVLLDLFYLQEIFITNLLLNFRSFLW